jgi:alkanesulfonate monooxygenase SsuD/methylene tetrahydromethanopterin reductase-like flavin-dependent oxidoreductase (luciferase family)
MASELPRLGVRLHQALAPQQSMDLAAAAEDCGFYSLWFAENPFHRGVLPTVAGCIARTRRIGVGLGIVNFYQRHPTLIAQEFAALDELAQGRVRLGIGSGIGAQIERLGIDYRPVSALTDAIHIVRALLRDGEANYEGKVFRAKDVALGFRAPRPEAPIYIASMGDRSLDLCGRLADGLIVSNLCPPGYTERAVGIVQAAAAAAGRPLLDIVQYVPCAARPDREEARLVAKNAIGGMLAALWPHEDPWPALRETIVRSSGIEKSEMIAALARLRRGEPADRVLDDRFVDAFAIAGSAEECLDQAARYRRAGAAELALTFAGDRPAADMAYLADRLRAVSNG